MKYLLYFISNMDLDSKILDVFQKMINDIIEVYTDKSDEIQSQYRDILEMKNLVLADCKPIDQFMKNIDIFSKKIENRDVEVLSNTIIPHIDLNAMFESSITDIDRNNIWKYLQTFCIININLNSSKELQELLSGETKEIDPENRKDLKDLKRIQKLKESISTINEKKVDESDMNGMNDIFSNTGIGQLAKEIAEGINFEEMLGQNGDLDEGEQNMENVMQNIMNPANFMNLFQNINTKVQDKIQSGDIDESMLTGEAQNLYGNFQDNPMFQSMMNNPELKKFQESMNNNNEETGGSDGNDAVETALETAKKNKSVRVEKLDENQKVIPKNKTEERLQKKLAEKQKGDKQSNQEKKIVIEGEKQKSVKTDNVKVEKTE